MHRSSDSRSRRMPIDQTWARPPSTNSSMPVTKLESSDAKNSAALAISSGSAMRPIGILDTTLACDGVRRLLIDKRRYGRTRAEDVGADATVLQLQRPSSDEISDGGLGC